MSMGGGESSVAVVINSRLGKHGSFEDFMIALARGAKRRDWTLHFVFPAVETAAIAQLLEAEGVTVHTVDAPWTSRTGAARLRRLLSEIRPDVANFHFCDNLQFVHVYRACRRIGIKVITHYHGEIRPLNQLRWRNKHLSLLRLLSFWTDQIVTISQANERFLEALRVAAPVEMIYNGIDTATFLDKADRAQVPPPANGDGAVTFLYIGQLIKRKQVPVLIHAFARVHREFPLARLVVIGGGADEPDCRALASELRLGECVAFTGLVSSYPFEQLRRSDVFVSASESESFGLVFAEAMCVGLPAVACHVGGIPEVVADGVTGLLVAPHDAGAFAVAMLRMARTPGLRHEMGRAGQRRAVDLFDVTDKVEQIFDLFERVAA